VITGAQAVAFLGLGANLRGRRATMARALVRLEDADLRVEAVSPLYESAPVGPVPDQPWFVNAVARVRTSLSPRGLLARCLAVETTLGRDRRKGIPKGPRIIDLDLLLHGDLVLRGPRLTLPPDGQPLAACVQELPPGQTLHKIPDTDAWWVRRDFLLNGPPSL